MEEKEGCQKLPVSASLTLQAIYNWMKLAETGGYWQFFQAFLFFPKGNEFRPIDYVK